jgi:uncharacterized delta-60 repeat protein
MSAAGTLDPSFNIDGKATADLIVTKLHATDVAVQTDGKTVVAGFVQVNNNENFQFAVTRFNFDGTPDRFFGPNGNGFVITKVREDGDSFAGAIAIQPDGKIVVAGNSDDRWALIRLNPDGSFDNTFVSDGTRKIGFEGDINDVLIQSNGKILLVGSAHDDGIFTPDSNFGVA